VTGNRTRKEKRLLQVVTTTIGKRRLQSHREALQPPFWATN
jgi:hypothetical protein